MAVLYVGLAVIIIITNITAVPAALASIVKSAFTGSALAGGAVGSMFVAMRERCCKRNLLKRVRTW